MYLLTYIITFVTVIVHEFGYFYKACIGLSSNVVTTMAGTRLYMCVFVWIIFVQTISLSSLDFEIKYSPPWDFVSLSYELRS